MAITSRQQLDQQDERPLVLLFYDGYERRARPGIPGAAFSHGHRFTRYVYKKVRRQQPRTGFYVWFLMLCEALRRQGCDVRINDFAQAAQSPDYPIGAAGYPSVIEAVGSLPNPRLLGPGLHTSPLEAEGVCDDPRNVLALYTCDWHTDVFAPVYGDRIRPWFGGFDVSRFTDARALTKTCDVLIYDKIYFNREHFYPATIGRFISMLEQRGLSYRVMRYGAHHYDDYIAALRTSRCMAFFAHQETQGMAYQECLASNVPIFAWDEGTWPSPVVEELNRGPIACTSVPYFDARCGVTFTIENMGSLWDAFFQSLDSFEPRQFVAERLTLTESAALYLRAYREVAMRWDGARARAPAPSATASASRDCQNA